MADYSLEALGRTVTRLRENSSTRLTQQQLGEAAGYSEGPGAGVSINRLEKGRLTPTESRLAAIAAVLGVSPKELAALAVEETRRATEEGQLSSEERLAAIVQASEQRHQLTEDLQALENARQEAERGFLLAFRDLAALGIAAPALAEEDLIDVDAASSEEAAAEAAFQIEFTRFGVSGALADSSKASLAGTEARGAAAYVALAEAVALRTAPLGAQIAGNSTALRGFLAAAGVGRSARLLGPVPAASLLGAVALGAVAVTIAERQARTNRARRQQESAAKLAEAEAEIALTQPNVDALIDVIARAKELFEYIALHASHALARWGNAIGEEAVGWEELEEPERQRYRDFESVAAAQLSVANIDLERLARCRGDDLKEAMALADQILIQAQRQIRSRV